MEISAFVQDSISNKNKNNNYPALINLRDSFLDKYLFTPITKFVSLDRVIYLGIFQYIILIILLSILMINHSTTIYKVNIITNWKETLYTSILAVILIIFSYLIVSRTRKRFIFIARAYYIDFISGSNKIINNQWQHFVDFYKYFKELSNIKIKDIKFYKIKIKKILMDNIELSNISFEKCNIRMEILNSSMSEIYFQESKIKSIKLENVILSNVIFNKCSFGKLDKNDYLISKSLYYCYYWNIIPIQFLLKNYIKISKRTYLKEIKPMIILNNVTMDEKSIKSFQTFILENNMKRKHILCNDLEFKNQLFNFDE
jgi:hypothetical protein